ncbi:MAG: TIGR03960 family B12-binding radical SAM protein [bacterium]
MIYPDKILRSVNNPAQYTGGEYNVIDKDPEGKVRICLSYPDLYSVGMSSNGHKLLYHMLNRKYNVYAERVYAVEPDMEKMLIEEDEPLRTLETGTPLSRFDMIGFTVEYELTYTNILSILQLSGIPLHSDKRSEDDPIVAAGGTAVYNPGPVESFIDVFFIGEIESMADDITDILARYSQGELSRTGALEQFNELPFTYIPALHKEGDTVERAKPMPLAASGIIRRPLVPNTRIVHDRVTVEISRGCTRGCRFCQAGIIYRPVREEPVDSIVQASSERLDATGMKEVSLLSLSATDYLDIGDLLETLSSRIRRDNANISLPSLRIGDIDKNLYNQISRVRKSGITIAVETASERLKSVINKNISEEEIFNTIETGVAFGWKKFKLYFMIGLPSENDSDVAAISDLLNSIASRFRHVKINASVSPFVPRPFTPFQWSEQISKDEMDRRISLIRNGLQFKNIQLNARDTDISYLEGVFARGGQELGSVIECAYNNGQRLDQWSEYFEFDKWIECSREMGIDTDNYLRERSTDDTLPWEIIQYPVNRAFLLEEYNKAKQGIYTPDCREGECTLCGACNGEIAGEKRRNEDSKRQSTEFFKSRKRKKIVNKLSRRIKMFFCYEVSEDYKYLSHLSMIDLISAGLRRSGLDFLYTSGYNPKIKMHYGPPKPVGVYSRMEVMEAFLQSKPSGNILSILNRAFPAGIKFYMAKELISDRMSVVKKLNRISMVFGFNVTDKTKEKIADFLDSEEYIIEREKKDKIKQYNIREFIDDIEIENNLVRVILKYNNNGSVKFSEIENNILGLNPHDSPDVYREKFYRKDNGNIIEVEKI